MKTEKMSCEALFRDFGNARAINRENLLRLLTDNQNTRYGRQNDFAAIRTPEDYAKKVPLTDSTHYQSLPCDPGAFTVYPVEALLATSGSSGRPKAFALTEQSLCRFDSYIQDMPEYLSHDCGKILHTSMFRSPKNGLTILSSAYYRWLRRSGKADFDRFAGGADLLFSEEVSQVPYVKTWLLFSCPDITSLRSIYLYDIIIWLIWLRQNWRTVIDDMKAGQISVPLAETTRQALLKNRPDPRRLAQVEQELAQGFHTPLLPRICPDLRYVCGIGGSIFALQEQQLRTFIGDLPIHYFAYALSEGMVGIATRFDCAAYTLLPRNAYYEFLTRDGLSVLPLEALTPGQIVEPVLSTFSGLYRYRTGDLLRVTGFEGEAPVLEVVGRSLARLDIAGEKMEESTAAAAMALWAKEQRLDVADYSFCVDEERIPSGYRLFWESSVPPEGNASPDRLTDALRESLDKALKTLSPDYQELRELGFIAPPVLCPLPVGTLARSQTAPDRQAHSKPRIILSREQAASLREAIDQNTNKKDDISQA